MNLQQSRSCAEQLEQLRKEYDEFAYIVSHDLKAPARAISNLSVWIEEDLGESVPADIKHQMELLRNRTSRMEQMIEALLQFSRVGTYNMEKGEASVSELLHDAISTNNGTKKITLNTTENLPVVFTFKEKLRYILSQLVQNAASFSNSNEVELTVSAKEKGDFYLFEFADNGGGVPEDALEKIFRLFYTVAPKDSMNTTGAGLTVARKITHFVGGEMWAANNPKGLSVFFTWPKQIPTKQQ